MNKLVITKLIINNSDKKHFRTTSSGTHTAATKFLSQFTFYDFSAEYLM